MTESGHLAGRDWLGYVRYLMQTTWPTKGLYRILNPGWYKEAIGREWESSGRRQFEFVVREGLKPNHSLLDVGCGSLRAGHHFVNYLDAGHYTGIDIERDLLHAGRKELERGGLDRKGAVLAQMTDFNFPSLGETFDYALANSVFTHLPLNAVLQCLHNMKRVLAPQGRFYATFFENPQPDNLEPIHRVYRGIEFMTYFDRDPYHYDFGLMETLARTADLDAEYIGEWVPGGTQPMMVFRRHFGRPRG